jgi:hypothetical protein
MDGIVSKEFGIFIRIVIFGVILGVLGKLLIDYIREKYSDKTVMGVFIIISIFVWLFILSMYYIGKHDGYYSCR